MYRGPILASKILEKQLAVPTNSPSSVNAANCWPAPSANSPPLLVSMCCSSVQSRPGTGPPSSAPLQFQSHVPSTHNSTSQFPDSSTTICSRTMQFVWLELLNFQLPVSSVLKVLPVKSSSSITHLVCNSSKSSQQNSVLKPSYVNYCSNALFPDSAKPVCSRNLQFFC